MKLICYFDGACEPYNPGGNMGIGAIILHEDKTLFEHSVYVPKHANNSNNVAEYSGFIALLKWLIENGHTETEILINGDSNLVIQQMGGSWKIKQGNYVKCAREAKELLKNFKNVTLKWIPRELNTIADELSKRPMKQNKCEFRIQKD